MQKTVTLKEVTEKIQIWRSQRKFKNQQIPDYLKQLIHQLFQHYKVCQIVNNLKISSGTLHSIRHKFASKTNNTQVNAQTAPMDFIPFRVIDPANNSLSNTAPAPAPSSCEIVRPDGFKLIINAVDIASIIKTFLCSN